MPSKDPEKRREAVRRYAAKHKEEVYARQRAWVERNREQVRAYAAEYAKRPETKALKKAYAAKHYQENKEQFQKWREENKAKMAQYARGYRRANSEKLIAVKRDRGCLICGQHDPRCLQFHHREPEHKEYSVSTMIGFPWDRIQAEIDKCDVLCANCHMIEHHDRKKVY